MLRKMLKKIIIMLVVGVLSFAETTTTTKPKSITESTKPKSITESTKTKKATTAKIVEKPKKVETKKVTKKNIEKVSKEDNRPEYRAVLVGDMNGNILYGENMNEKYPLASTTKVMTMILTFEALKNGQVSLDDEVEISPNAARMGGAMIPLKAGQKFRLEELIKATAIHSANNAAYAVAEHVGKGFDNFITMMNQKASELGISEEVQFFTPAGLPPKMTQRGMDVGSSKGMYKLMLEANKYPEYVEIAGTKFAKIENETVLLRNKNKLLGKDGIYGLKTGFHNTSGYNILVMGEKEDTKLCYIVFGGRTAKIRDEKVIQLDHKIREEIVKKEILDQNQPLGTLSVKKGKLDKIDMYADSSYERIVKKTDNVVVKMEKKESVVAPIKKGDEVGKYKVYVNEQIVYEGKILVKEDIEKKQFFGIF